MANLYSPTNEQSSSDVFTTVWRKNIKQDQLFKEDEMFSLLQLQI